MRYSCGACLISFLYILIFQFIPIKLMAVGPFAGPSYKSYKLGYLETSIQMERFFTNTNFDENGKKINIGTNYPNFLTSYDYSYKGRLTYTPSFAFSGGFIAHSVDTDDGQLLRSRTGVGEVFVGADYRWIEGDTDVIFDYKAVITPYHVPDSTMTDLPIWADGANSFCGNLIIQRRFGPVLSYGFAGYNYRDSGLSDYYPIGAGIQWAIEGWIIGSELKANLLAEADKNFTSAVSGRHDQLKVVNGGSYKNYSTNPDWASLEVNFKYRLTSQFAFNAGGGTILKGTNFVDGNFWYLGLQLQWPIFLQEISGKADVQKKMPDFSPNIPSFKKKIKNSTDEGSNIE